MEGIRDTEPYRSTDKGSYDSSTSGVTNTDRAEQVRIDAVFNQFKGVMAVIGRANDFFAAYKEKADILLPLAKQLPAEKILEVKVGEYGWTYLHFVCQNRPADHALQIIDKFSSEQIYTRVDTHHATQCSPLKLTIDNALHARNLFNSYMINSPELFAVYAVVERIINRANPVQLASVDGAGVTDLEHIRLAISKDRDMWKFEKLYMERLNPTPAPQQAISVTTAASSLSPPNIVTITDPRQMVAALIANENATDIDVHNVIDLLRPHLDKIFTHAAHSQRATRDVALEAIHSIRSLQNRVAAVEQALDVLSANPKEIALPPGFDGAVTYIMRVMGRKIDPITSALSVHGIAREKANNLMAAGRGMLSQQIKIAQNQEALKEPFDVMDEAFTTAIKHYEAKGDQGKQKRDLFVHAADMLALNRENMSRLIDNTQASSEVANGLIMFAREMDAMLDTLAVEVAELATHEMRVALRKAYSATDDAPILAMVKDRLIIAMEKLKPAQAQLPQLEQQVQEIVLTPLEAPAQTPALTPVS